MDDDENRALYHEQADLEHELDELKRQHGGDVKEREREIEKISNRIASIKEERKQ